jgi:hypothetical protein
MGVALSPQLGDRIEQMIYNKPKLWKYLLY